MSSEEETSVRELHPPNHVEANEGACRRCTEDTIVYAVCGHQACLDCITEGIDHVEGVKEELDEETVAKVIDHNGEPRYIRRLADGSFEQDYSIGEGRSRVTALEATVGFVLGRAWLEGNLEIVGLDEYPMTENRPAPEGF